MTHTPGPWKVYGRPAVGIGKLGVQGILAQTMGRLDTPHLQRLANARLIASAPDLLAQRNELLEALENFVGIAYEAEPEFRRGDLAQAEAAIALAKGEAA